MPHQTDALSRYGRDLTAMAARGELPPIVGRASETDVVVEILSAPEKANVVLLGEPGVGKTAIAEALAQLIVARAVPRTLAPCRLIELSLTSLLANTKFTGQLEDHVQGLLSALTGSQTILFVDEVHNLVGAGRSFSDSKDVANLMKPILARGLKCIGATTSREWQECVVAVDGAFARRFQPVVVGEPGVDQTLLMLAARKPHEEKHYGLRIAFEALEAAAFLATEWLTDRRNPDKSLDLLRAAVARRRLELDSPAAARKLRARVEELRVLSNAMSNDPAEALRWDSLVAERTRLEQRLVRAERVGRKTRLVTEGLPRLERRAARLEQQVDALLRAGENERAARIKYGPLLETQARTRKFRALSARFPAPDSSVGAEDVAAALAARVSVPASSLVSQFRARRRQSRKAPL